MTMPSKRFRFLLADDRSIYGVLHSGELLWYEPEGNIVALKPPPVVNEGRQIGVGWADFARVFTGGNGIIYAITTDGQLLWYQDLFRNGTNASNGATGWAANSGHPIGTGWETFTKIISGNDGIIYAVQPTGEILWYRDIFRNGSNAADGSTGWASGSGSQIGQGWEEFSYILSGGKGVIYAVLPNGELTWYRDDFRDGTNGPLGNSGWAARSGSTIDQGWDSFTHIFSGGDGVIYACQPREFGQKLLQYHDTLRDGTNGPTGVGWRKAPEPTTAGWQIAGIEGYCWPTSASPGETLSFHVSAMHPGTAEVSYVRLTGRGPELGTLVENGPTFECDFQPNTTWTNDLGWPLSFELELPDWHPGFYAARLKSSSGALYDVPFVVKRNAVQGDLALLVNINTWNAYNTWGGASNYTGHGAVTLSFKRPNHHLLAGLQDHGSGNHMLRSEIWLFDWLADQDYRVDLYTDIDLENGIIDLNSYKALVLNTHPEYWTRQMMTAVTGYLNNGRSVLYLGGNGMYRPTTLRPGSGLEIDCMETNAVQWDAEDYPTYEGKPLLAARVDNLGGPPEGTGVRISAPLHRFFPDTVVSPGGGSVVVSPGMLLGTSGWNGDNSSWGASGWETDHWAAPLPQDVSELARDPWSDGAVIASYETSAGGFVLGVGSITFVGSLMVDNVLQQMITNAINEALARP